MRIGIDARYLSHGIIGGVHSYVAFLIPALLEAAPDCEFYLYCDIKKPFELDNLPDNVTVRVLNYRNGFSTIYNDLVGVRSAMTADNLDIAHFPANYGFGPANARTIITLHDQINVLPLSQIIRAHKKDVRSIAMMSYLHFCSRPTVYAADLIITMSDYSREHILQNINLNPEQVVVWTNGPAPDLAEITDPAILAEVSTRFEINKPFVIADAIKNPGTLVEAWKLLSAELREQYRIVFFSRIPTPPQPVQEAVEAGYAHFLVRPSDQDLRALYSMAQALAFPSWYEGLGLPLLEAMTCGAPVVASDRGAIPYVVGDAALTCDLDDIPGFSRNLTRVLNDPAEHARLKNLGYERATRFTWDKTAQAYLGFYERVLSDNPAHAVSAPTG